VVDMSSRMFIHGLESSPQGTKAVFFRKRYPDMLIPHFTGPLRERMDQLNAILAGKREITLVGSSFGGLMASIFAMENEDRTRKLILLAPAINLMDLNAYTKGTLALPVWIYHGTQDEVIALEEVEKVARNIFSDLRFHAVEDDHYLHKIFEVIPWDQLLS
jgi:pimeloyl-ACP methyl ester carboxylesterase